MKNTVRRLLAALIVLAMVFSLSGAALALGEDVSVNDGALEAKPTVSYDLSGIRNGHTFDLGETKANEEIAADQIVTIMVQLKDAPAMKTYKDYKSAESYAASLLKKQNEAVKSIEKRLGLDIDVLFNYTLLFNGFSFEGEYRLVEELNEMDGITAFVAAEWDCPEIQLYNSGDMVGAIDAWDLDYTGEGTIIAIVDTGLMVDHPAFSTMPDEETVKFTKADIASIIAEGNLQGSKNGVNMNADNVYYNAKIPFRWNYTHMNYNVAHVYNDHGTHVAGIAAGNGGEITGIAKDAQIAGMLVFQDSGGAGWAQIIAALEDCVVLGVDAANLSLGSPCGFTSYSSASYGEVFENLVNAGVNLSMSAGNEYSTALMNKWYPSGIGYCLVQNPDYGVTGSPGTWPRSLSVASVDNTKGMYNYIEDVASGSKIPYNENADNAAKLADTLGDQTVDFISIPGYGTEEDFAQVDVQGKVAVVSRGEINFVAKGQNAQAAGAVACIIRNNQSGNSGMVTDPSITIPFVIIAKEYGDVLAEEGEGQLYFSAEPALVDAIGGGEPSSFSSWGTTSDLAIKPEITAPGGNIYSSTDPRPTMSGEYYQVWSGTSMSAPHVAGGMAIVTNYVNEMFPNLSTAEKQEMVDAILMSTAKPVKDSGGDFAAVRKQGAGLMDLASAVTTTSYLSVEGCARPKLELGDDPEKTGVYEMTFTINNFGDKEISYTVDPHVLIDDIQAVAEDPDGNYVLAYTQTSWDVSEYCDFEMPEVVKVPAGESVDVTVTVSITGVAGYIDYYYPAGAFVEGFIELYADNSVKGDVNGDGKVDGADALLVMRYSMELDEIDNLSAADVNGDGAVDMADALIIARYNIGKPQNVPIGEVGAGNDLNIPFLAYYGDWNAVPMLDQGFYYDDYSYGSNPIDNFIGSTFGKDAYGLGINPYVETEDFSYYDEDRNAISPNGDGFLDTVNTLYCGLMRNAAEMGAELYTADGTLIRTLSRNTEVRKDYCSTSTQVYSNRGAELGLPNWNAASFADQDLVIRIYAYLLNDGSITTEAFTEDTENMFNEWLVPVYVDTENPIAEVISYEDGVLELDVYDNHYAAFVGVFEGEVDEDGMIQFTNVIGSEGIFEDGRGADHQATFEGVEGEVYVCIADYAGNEVVYTFDGENLVEVGDNWSHQEHEVVVPELDMYGYWKNPATGGNMTWLRFNTGDMSSLYYGGGITVDNNGYDSAAFTGEYVYAMAPIKSGTTTTGYNLYRYDAAPLDAWTDLTLIGEVTGLSLNSSGNPYTVNEMAYDRVTDTIYAVCGLSDIVAIDVETAEATPVCSAGYGVAAIDFAPDGTCYIVDAFGYFCTLDVETGAEIENYGYLGITPYQSGFLVQSGCYADGFFFWMSAPGSISSYSQVTLQAIEISSKECVDLGNLNGGFYIIGMFAGWFPIVPATEPSVEAEDFYENFENGFDWEVVDADDDGMNWAVDIFDEGLYVDGNHAAVSYSWLEEVLTPDNWMISPEFTLGAGERYLSFYTASANYSPGSDIDEHYAVYVIPEGGDIEDAVPVYEKTMDHYWLVEHVVDLSAFAGQTVKLAFRHFDCTDEYTLIIDSIAVGSAIE
ncbi:MAG: S8 family serine peptidase [Clostridiales bacterium]|nr:S8 family serine peptidase [Clostridiales bacterium]